MQGKKVRTPMDLIGMSNEELQFLIEEMKPMVEEKRAELTQLEAIEDCYRTILQTRAGFKQKKPLAQLIRDLLTKSPGLTLEEINQKLKNKFKTKSASTQNVIKQSLYQLTGRSIERKDDGKYYMIDGMEEEELDPWILDEKEE